MIGIIYKATNLINGKKYIGKTTNQLEERKFNHSYDASNFRTNMVFHKAIRKYGWNNFKWEILCECNDILLLNIRETMKIIVEHSHKSEGKGYNLTWGGESGCLGYKFTEEQKKILSKKLKGHEVSQETRIKLHNFNIGKKLTEEHKRKMSDAHKGDIGELNNFYGKKHTKESKQKIGDASRKYNDTIISNIKQMLDDGMSRHFIATETKIPYPTLNEWIRKYVKKGDGYLND